MKWKGKISSRFLLISLVIFCGFSWTTITAHAEEEYYSFNPHAYSSKLYATYGEERWKAFYNLCDALRAGEDTFECPSADVYGWCMSNLIITNFFPVAGNNLYYINQYGEYTYSDGVGYINYAIPKEEFLQRERDFENTVNQILRENVRTDYTDFEKCLALYNYISKNYSYDYEQLAVLNTENAYYWGSYDCLMTKKGVCEDISALYNFLLMECGVDALQYMGASTGTGHSWSYVTIDGVGYHIDPTWGLSDDGGTDLAYFMMSTEERLTGSMSDYNIRPYLNMLDVGQGVDFSANDNRYAPIHQGYFAGLDRERKILIYDINGERREFNYSNFGTVSSEVNIQF
jgi:hypothetical protein